MYKYIPIIRDGRNERSVVQDLAPYGASGNSNSSLFPLIEITDEDDLANLVTYRRVAGEIMVELPIYLLPSADQNSQNVRDTYQDNNSDLAEFYRNELDASDVPVITGLSDRPVDYSNLLGRYRDVISDFSKVAVRIFVRSVELDNRQISDLRTLLSNVRDQDIVLLDQVDVSGFEHPAYSNLQTLADEIQGNDTFMLNAFKYDESPHNYGPVLTVDLDFNGFGDFGINRRFNPPMGGGPPTVYIRHYLEDMCELEDFSGDDYGEAFTSLRASPHFNQNHCHFCSNEAMSGNRDHSTWKRFRMGHYMDCILDDTLARMETQSIDEIDSSGYADIS